MYIDPNTGGMLFQILAASLALFTGAILLFSSKIRAFAARLRRSARGEQPEQENGTAQTGTPASEDENNPQS
jgi:hypothetical protein